MSHHISFADEYLRRLNCIVGSHCRFPFLLVDRVVELEPEKYAVGYKNVTINDNFFPGHFPQRAIMPGRIGVMQLPAHSALPSRNAIAMY